MGDVQKPAKATPLQVAKAVLWSFFGIRKRAAYEKDAVSLTLPQVVVAGIIGALVLVLSLIVLVRLVTS
ncbi:MAG: DUF2970 domain-containing protein [Betaproteobacteria bacterium]|nr:DUF2970 domain-containing protein [Betaproteobacteria bacterium]MBI3056259.1 DUF2970 domain-containing protein [Betaproteobacteria bacterium]